MIMFYSFLNMKKIILVFKCKIEGGEIETLTSRGTFMTNFNTEKGVI
jgi:hypothetical protein